MYSSSRPEYTVRAAPSAAAPVVAAVSEELPQADSTSTDARVAMEAPTMARGRMVTKGSPRVIAFWERRRLYR
jgi:hypothetical protein